MKHRIIKKKGQKARIIKHTEKEIKQFRRIFEKIIPKRFWYLFKDPSFTILIGEDRDYQLNELERLKEFLILKEANYIEKSMVENMFKNMKLNTQLEDMFKNLNLNKKGLKLLIPGYPVEKL